MAARKKTTKKVSGLSNLRKATAVAGVRKKRKSTPKTKKRIGKLAQGESILGTIGKLESRYKKAKDKDLKKLLALEINAEHDKLDRLYKAYNKVK